MISIAHMTELLNEANNKLQRAQVKMVGLLKCRDKCYRLEKALTKSNKERKEYLRIITEKYS